MAEFGSIDSLVNWTTAEDSAVTERMSATVVTSDGDTGEPGQVAPLTAVAGLGQEPYAQEVADDGEHRPDDGAVEPGNPGDLVEISGDGTPPEPHDPPSTDPTAPAREDTPATEDDPATQSPPILETSPSDSTPSDPSPDPETPTPPGDPETPGSTAPGPPADSEGTGTPDAERPPSPTTPDRPEGTPSSGEPTPDRPAATTPEDTAKAPDVAKPPTATTPKTDDPEKSPKATTPAAGGGGMPSGATPDPTAATPTTPAAAANKDGSGKERPQDPKATALSDGGVSGDWRKARPEAMERLGQSLAPTQAGGTHTPGDRFRAVERMVRGATPGFPGFGLVGKFAFDGAYDAARNSAADYLKHAKNQLGRWQTQLNEGAKVIRDANAKSTPKK
ncbi:hypothetical protein ACIA8R_31090 [Nonomuraea sp. NPDC051191]|uniref:hypothetical protein n=1 Tax=Nonomuraea sp. NPDC051191 TaxID=3364372 RepID=UPI00378F69D5